MYLATQGGVQAVGIVVGLLLVNLLDKHDYALYTLGVALLTAATVFTDGGVTSALSASGGQKYKDKAAFSALVASGLKVRKTIGLLALLMFVPLATYLFHKNGVPLLISTALALLLMGAMSVQLTTAVLLVVPRLLSRIGIIQAGDSLAAAVRLVGVVFLMIIPKAFVALAVTALSYLIQNIFIRRKISTVIDLNAMPNSEDSAYIKKIARRQALPAMYFGVQGQVVYFLLAAIGASGNIAEVGALARLAIILQVFNAFAQNMVAPGFAKASGYRQIKERLIKSLAAMAFVYFAIFLIVYVLREPLLMLLGPNYAHLQTEFMICFAGSCCSAAVNVLGILNKARAWVAHSWIYIPLSMGWMLLMIGIIDISETRGAVIFGAVAFVPALLLNVARTWASLRTIKHDGIERHDPLS